MSRNAEKDALMIAENRQRLLYAINRKLANKIYDILT